MGRVVAVVAVAAAVACAPGPGDGGTVTVTDAYAAEPVSRETGAVYLTIENRGAEPDTLVGAWTPIASMAHLHRMGGAGGARMQTQDVLEIPAGARVRLRPGDLHLMLMTITAMPQAGDTVDLHLEFAHAGAVSVRVPVLTYLEVGERATVGAERDNS